MFAQRLVGGFYGTMGCGARRTSGPLYIWRRRCNADRWSAMFAQRFVGTICGPMGGVGGPAVRLTLRDGPAVRRMCGRPSCVLTHAGGHGYVRGFWGIADLVGAGLVADGGADADGVAAVVRGNGDGERNGDSAFVNVDRAFGKLEFAVAAARIADRADTSAGCRKADGRRDGVFAIWPVGIYVQAVRDIYNDGAADGFSACSGADRSGNGLGG